MSEALRDYEQGMQYDSDEGTKHWTCTFIGCRKNQVFDSSFSRSASGIGDEEDEDEEAEAGELFEINLRARLDPIKEECESSLFSFDFGSNEDKVYVAVTNTSHSSMEALSWTLEHILSPSTTVYLLHVFPQVRLIPSPLGKIPRHHVSPELVEAYLAQEKEKRRVHLQKFINLCSASKVKMEVMLVEGNNVANTIVDIVRDLGIRKMVVGTSKFSKSKAGSKRRQGVAANILKIAPESCDVKVICKGKEVIYQMMQSVLPCPSEVDGSDSEHPWKEDAGQEIFPYKSVRRKSIWLFRPKLGTRQ